MNYSIGKILSALLFAFVLIACGRREAETLDNGIWRATLKTSSGAEIPFNFEVTDSAGLKLITIINGSERLRVDEIETRGDSIFITMPFFDSEILAQNKGNRLEGTWIKHLAESDAVMKFSAEAGRSWRFFKAGENPKKNISGRWSASFINPDNGDTTVAIGEFSQENSRLQGTFLTTTGDYRFLEGTVSDNKLYLSSFDGGGAYLFTGQLLNDSTIVQGKFYSGASYVANWVARKDAKAVLPDAYSLTGLKKGYSRIDFSFPDLNGQNVSLSDPRFNNKVVLVQFLGSWCPNCMDETAYLVPFYNRYNQRGVEIIGLAYERTSDPERSRKNVERLRSRFNVPYDLLLTGHTSKKEDVARSLPMLDNFIAFPTLIIIDKKGRVRKIHAGFNGPGTGRHYTEFVQEFEETIDNLLAES